MEVKRQQVGRKMQHKMPSNRMSTCKGPQTAGLKRRCETILRSFRVLRNLTPEQVDNFMKSYIIYDLDWANEKMMTENLGSDYRTKVGECLRDYYSVLNHVCALGELEKMYIPPIMDLNAGITKNQDLYEESVAKELQLPPRPRLLGLGCGRGRVAAHMTRLTGARVTGVNIDDDQITSAIAYNKQMDFRNDFIRRDFNDLPLPLPDNEFDGFYNIQAFSLCEDIPTMCRELYRVLKPGARLSLLDWVKLDAFTDNDEHHLDLMRKVKPLIGAVGTPTPGSMIAAIESVGFRMISHGNASVAADGLQAPLIERADAYFRHARHGLSGLARLGLLPAHFKTIMERFARDGEAFIEADKARLITTCYHWLAEKPRDVPLAATMPTADAGAEVHVKDWSSGKASMSSSMSGTKFSSTDSTGISTPRSLLGETDRHHQIPASSEIGLAA